MVCLYIFYDELIKATCREVIPLVGINISWDIKGFVCVIFVNIDWPKERFLFDRIACVFAVIKMWWLFDFTSEQ